MKKYILILILFLMASCASRKVNIEKIDIQKDSVSETKIIVTTVENEIKTDSTNITTTTDNSEITITPIDSSKTIIVDGKSYKNVVLKIKKTKANTLYINNKKEYNNKRIDSVATAKVEVKEQTTGKTKTIDKKANYWFLFYWLILILILYLLWRNRPLLLKRL
jgi:ATP-dependent Zn protease